MSSYEVVSLSSDSSPFSTAVSNDMINLLWHGWITTTPFRYSKSCFACASITLCYFEKATVVLRCLSPLTLPLYVYPYLLARKDHVIQTFRI